VPTPTHLLLRAYVLPSFLFSDITQESLPHRLMGLVALIHRDADSNIIAAPRLRATVIFICKKLQTSLSFLQIKMPPCGGGNNVG